LSYKFQLLKEKTLTIIANKSFFKNKPIKNTTNYILKEEEGKKRRFNYKQGGNGIFKCFKLIKGMRTHLKGQGKKMRVLN